MAVMRARVRKSWAAVVPASPPVQRFGNTAERWTSPRSLRLPDQSRAINEGPHQDHATLSHLEASQGS